MEYWLHTHGAALQFSESIVALSPTAQPAGLLLPGLLMKTAFKLLPKVGGRPVAAKDHPGLDLVYVHIPPFDPTAHPSTGPIVEKNTDVILQPFTLAH